MPRLVHLIADYGAGDLAFAEVVQRIALALPDAVVQFTPVGEFDTLAAGFCVAQLALTDGPPDRLVIHDVTERGDGDPRGRPADTRFCTGRTDDGVTVVGPNAGWAWSFAVDELHGLCHVDVPADPFGFRSHDFLTAAITHVASRHPHAVCDDLDRSAVPPVPERVVAYIDGYGNLTTTMTERPGRSGEHIVVQIGQVSATAVIADHPFNAADELVLAPGPSGWMTRDGRMRRFLELVVPGGSAAALFAYPQTGAEVTLRPTRADEGAAGRAPAPAQRA